MKNKISIALLASFLLVIITTTSALAHSMGSDADAMVRMMQEQMGITHEQAEQMMQQMMSGQGQTQPMMGGMTPMMSMMMSHGMMNGMMCPMCGWLGWTLGIFSLLFVISLTVFVIVLTIWFLRKIRSEGRKSHR